MADIAAFIDWLNRNAGAVQALAAVIALGLSIIALGLSIYVPYRLDAKARKRANEERDLQARALAVAIFPELLEMRPLVDRAQGRWTQAQGGLVGPGTAAQLEPFRLRLPPGLGSGVDRFYVLGDPAAPALIQLAAVATQYNRMIDELQTKVRANQEVQLEQAATAVSPHLNAIGTLIDDAKRAIEPIHDRR